MEEELKALREKVATQAEELAEFEEFIESSKRVEEELHAECAQHEARAKTARIALDTVQTRMADLESRYLRDARSQQLEMEKLLAALKEAESRASAAQAETRRLENSMDSAEDRIRQLEASLTYASNDRDRALEKLALLQAELDTLHAEAN